MAKLDYTDFFGEKHYINKTIPKEKWIKAGMTEKAREVFESFFVSSRILYAIPVVDTDFLIIEVMISKMSRRQTIFSDALHSSMPYPIMLIQNYKDIWYKVSTVNSRPNSNNNRREIVENHQDSRWTTDEGLVSLLSKITKQIKFSTSKRLEIITQINYCLHEFNSTPKEDWYYSAEDEGDNDDDSADRNNPYYLEQELALANNKIQELAEVSYNFALDKGKMMAAIMFEDQYGEQLAFLNDMIQEFFYVVRDYRRKTYPQFSAYYEDDDDRGIYSSWPTNVELEYPDEKDEDLQKLYRIHAELISEAIDSLTFAIRKKGSFFNDPIVKKRINRLQAVVEEMSIY